MVFIDFIGLQSHFLHGNNNSDSVAYLTIMEKLRRIYASINEINICLLQWTDILLTVAVGDKRMMSLNSFLYCCTGYVSNTVMFLQLNGVINQVQVATPPTGTIESLQIYIWNCLKSDDLFPLYKRSHSVTDFIQDY